MAKIWTGSMINAIQGQPHLFPTMKVGDGMTELLYSDRHAHTVVEVLNDGKVLKVQRDHAKRIDKNGMSESQTYSYEPRPDAPVQTLAWDEKQGCFREKPWTKRGGRFVPGRQEYYDFSR